MSLLALLLGRPRGAGEARLNLHAPQMLVMLSDIATMAASPQDAADGLERLRLIAKLARKTVADATGQAE